MRCVAVAAGGRAFIHTCLGVNGGLAREANAKMNQIAP